MSRSEVMLSRPASPVVPIITDGFDKVSVGQVVKLADGQLAQVSLTILTSAPPEKGVHRHNLDRHNPGRTQPRQTQPRHRHNLDTDTAQTGHNPDTDTTQPRHNQDTDTT